MPRTILYYPSITIQNPAWVKKTILYWDRIGTIIPSNLDQRLYLSSDMKMLQSEGLLRLFHPEDSVAGSFELEQEFIDIHQASEYITYSRNKSFSTVNRYHRVPTNNKSDQYIVYYEKFPERLAQYLIETNLATRNGSRMVLRKKDGLLYMSILAKYLANQDRDTITIPGTDYRAYQSIVFKSRNQKENIPGLSFSMNNLLPVPRQNVSLEKILHFKAQRQQELFHFQEVIEQCQNQIKNAKEEVEIRDIAINFQDRLKIEVENLIKIFKDKKASFALGTVENIIKIETPAILGSLATLGTISVPIVVAGALVAGAITLRKYDLDIRIAQQETLGAHSYAYLYSAYSAGIINRP